MILAFLLALPFPTTGTIHLPRGVTEVASEIRLADGAHDLTILGDGSTLRAAANFHGRAILSCHGCRRIEFRNFSIDGNRDAIGKPVPMAPSGKSFSDVVVNNGILVEDTTGFSVDHLDLKSIAGYAILVNHSSDVSLDHLTVSDSGSLNAKGRNNTTGGVLLEEGTGRFTVAGSIFQNIRGNGVWTHSRYMSPRNGAGKIANNQFSDIGRDAIQVGHATQVDVAGNRGSRIGTAVDLVDVENGGTPGELTRRETWTTRRTNTTSSKKWTGNVLTWMAFMMGSCAAIAASTGARRKNIRSDILGLCSIMPASRCTPRMSLLKITGSKG